MFDPTKDRNGYVGGSDVSGVMGLSRWTTPLSLWAEKTGKTPPTDLSEIEAVELGTELEDFVARKFARKTGKKVKVDNRDFTHPDYPYMKAHIDRWIVGGEILECKTCSAYKAGEWADDGIPDEYVLQLNWYLGIVGHKIGHIAVLIGGQSFRYKQMDFSKKLFDRQVECVKDFWENYVLKDVAPMAISTDQETLVGLFPSSRTGELIKLDGSDPDMELRFNQLAVDRNEGKCQIKEIENDVDLADNTLRQLIGDEVGIESGQWIATWKSQNSTRVDVEAMKEDGVYSKYAKTKEIRVLRVKEKKAKK